MKMKKWYNNKGMAIVTVLIAIMFIGILATSMLYMSYMNYVSKSVRYSSTDNFYTSEYGLADLSTALQNKAANAVSVNQAFKQFSTEDIDTVSGISHILTTNPSSGVECYDPYALQTLIQLASQESKIEVFTTDEYDTDGDGRWADIQNYEMDSKSITFLGVKLRSTTSDGFVTTISTDIKITFDSSDAEMDVNDFSVITDSAIELTNKDVIFSGNVFIGNQNAKTVDGKQYALVLQKIAIMTLFSKRAIINGNVIVRSGCTLIIGGNCTVYGEILVEKGGTLIVTGNLVHTGELNCKSGSILKGIEKNHAADTSLKAFNVKGNDEGKLAEAILSSVYVKSKSEDKWKEMTLTQFLNATGDLPNTFAQYKENNGNITSEMNGYYMSAYFYVPNPCNGLENALVLNSKGTEMEIRGDARNTTIVSTVPVVYYGDHKTTYMQNLSDEDYDRAKNILIKGAGQINGIDSQNYDFAGGDLGKTVTFPIADPDDQYKLSSADPVAGTKGRTVYFKNNQNYVPAGYFIAENASTIISQAFSVGTGEPDPKNSAVSYSRWTKE